LPENFKKFVIRLHDKNAHLLPVRSVCFCLAGLLHLQWQTKTLGWNITFARNTMEHWWIWSKSK